MGYPLWRFSKNLGFFIIFISAGQAQGLFHPFSQGRVIGFAAAAVLINVVNILFLSPMFLIFRYFLFLPIVNCFRLP